jgi:hypothetical protein
MLSISIILFVVLIICLTVNGQDCNTSNNCQNGAICISTGGNTHICICPPNFTGPLCDYPNGIFFFFIVKKIFKIYFKDPVMLVRIIHVSMEQHVRHY